AKELFVPSIEERGDAVEHEARRYRGHDRCHGAPAGAPQRLSSDQRKSHRIGHDDRPDGRRQQRLSLRWRRQPERDVAVVVLHPCVDVRIAILEAGEIEAEPVMPRRLHDNPTDAKTLSVVRADEAKAWVRRSELQLVRVELATRWVRWPLEMWDRDSIGR